MALIFITKVLAPRDPKGILFLFPLLFLFFDKGQNVLNEERMFEFYFAQRGSQLMKYIFVMRQ